MRDLNSTDPIEIGGYEILRVLGEGNMGIVYQGRKDNLLTAVKVMHRHIGADPILRARFRNEIQTARRVKSVFTANVMDDGSDNGMLWFASEYVPGSTIQEVAAEKRFSESEGLKLAYDLGRALMDIHRAGIVHRDLKPSNVIMGRNLKVVDFGIAYGLGDPRLTMPNAQIGTPLYMSPERLRAQIVEPRTSWDIFAFGGVLVYAVTGHPPFQGPTRDDVLVAIVRKTPDLRQVPPRLRPIVSGCLMKDPRDRLTLPQMMKMLYLIDPQFSLGKPAGKSASTSVLGRARVGDSASSNRTRPPGRAVPGSANDSARRTPERSSAAPDPSLHLPKPKKKESAFSWAHIVFPLIGAVVTAGHIYTQSNGTLDFVLAEEISLPDAVFRPAELPQTGGDMPVAAEAEARTLILTFQGDEQARQRVLDNSCVMVSIDSNGVYIEVGASDAHSNGTMTYPALNYPGEIRFVSDCSAHPEPSQGLLVGTNEVPYPGSAYTDDRVVPVIDAVISDDELKVVVPKHHGFGKKDAAAMCLSTEGGALKPDVDEVKHAGFPYLALTFGATKGTLYASCQGDSNNGSGVELK